MLRMVTDFQYCSMVVSLSVLRASKALLKAPWHNVPWKLLSRPDWGLGWEMPCLGAWGQLLCQGGHFWALNGNELGHYPRLIKPWRKGFCHGDRIQLLGNSCGTFPEIFQMPSMLFCSISNGLAYGSRFSLWMLMGFVLCVPWGVFSKSHPWLLHIIARLPTLWMI